MRAVFYGARSAHTRCNAQCHPPATLCLLMLGSEASLPSCDSEMHLRSVRIKYFLCTPFNYATTIEHGGTALWKDPFGTPSRSKVYLGPANDYSATLYDPFLEKLFKSSRNFLMNIVGSSSSQDLKTPIQHRQILRRRFEISPLS